MTSVKQLLPKTVLSMSIALSFLQSLLSPFLLSMIVPLLLSKILNGTLRTLLVSSIGKAHIS